MRALVTGAAGFIGANLAVELASDGWDVVALDDFSCGTFDNLKDFRGDVVTADVGDVASWDARVGRVDLIFHQAAITDTTVTDQAKMLRVNVEAFRALLGWAEASKAAKIVYASSAGTYGDLPVPMAEGAAPKPLNVYAFSKVVMERVACESRRPCVGLRYFNVYGPREAHKAKAASMIWQLAQQMRAGRRPRIFERGEQFRDFIYVKDVVAANLLAAKGKATGVFNVCTGKKTTFNGVIALLNEALGTRLEPDYFKNPYGFYQNETLGDPAAARQELGFEAEYDVRAGIEDYFKGRRVPARVASQ